MAEIIGYGVAFLLGAICLLYGIMTYRYKGPLLMNKYLLASDAERMNLKHMPEEERKKDYRYVSKISFALSAVWFLFFLSFVTVGIWSKLFFWAGMAVSCVVVAYSLKELFQNNRS